MDIHAGPKITENHWTPEKMQELDRALRLMVASRDRAHPSMDYTLLRTKLQNTHEEITRLQLQAAELMIQFNKDLEVLIDTY